MNAELDTREKHITMPCDIESRRPTHRQAAWHQDCPEPATCSCLAHERDEADREGR